MNKEVKKKTSKQDVYRYIDEIATKLNNEGRIATATAYKNASKSLRRYRAKLNFSQVDVIFLKDYESKLKKEGKSISSIGIYLRHFKVVFNKAIEQGVVDQKYYPFGKSKYQIKASRNIKKELTIYQIKSIVDYKVKVGST